MIHVGVSHVDDPCGCEPFGYEPFGCEPCGYEPFGCEPFGYEPFGCEPFGSEPCGVNHNMVIQCIGCIYVIFQQKPMTTLHVKINC